MTDLAKQSDLVSVCIPVYNAADYIGATLSSILGQTYSNLEILVIDDGSIDNSLEIINKFEDNRIKIIKQKNSGAACARNLGIKTANGKYIQFMDADDILSPNKIADQIAVLAEKPNAIAVCKTIFFYEDENPYSLHEQKGQDLFLFNTKDPINFLLNLWGVNAENRHGMVQTNAWLVPKALIDKTGYWSEFYSPDDDGEYFCKVLSFANEVCYTPNCFNYYRKFRNKNSLSSRNSHQALLGIYKSICNKEIALSKKVESTILEKVIKRQLFDVLYHSYGKYPDIVKKIIEKHPELIFEKYRESIGGTIINQIKNIFGWRFAKTIQNLRAKLIV